MSVEIPHFAWPFTVSDGAVETVEQNTPEEIQACELAIIACPVGWRPSRPDFGWKFPVFETMPLDLSPLETALDTLEPRGEADVTQYMNEAAQAVARINVEVGVSG